MIWLDLIAWLARLVCDWSVLSAWPDKPIELVQFGGIRLIGPLSPPTFSTQQIDWFLLIRLTKLTRMDHPT